ncbi:MAG: hypothetical protein V3T72_04970, partial [Thermoanaerobaculia bacterium]
DTWIGFEQYFQGLHANWNAFAVDTLDTGGVFFGAETYAENASRLSNYITTERMAINAWQIDLLAHSMGGLISRRYVHSQMPRVPLLGNKPLADRLLMMGTPHLGTTCADKWGGGGVPLLRPGYLAVFNQQVTKRKGVTFSALAGNPFAEFHCDDTMVDNDGWVTVPSATANISDNTERSIEHNEMTDETEADVTNYIQAKLVPGGASFAEPGRIPGQPLAGTGNFDNQLIHAEDLTIGVGEKVTTSFSVPVLSQMTVWFPYDSQLEVVLRNPGGIPSGTFQSAVWVATIEQQNPTPGLWTLEVTNNTSESGVFPVSVWVEGYPYLAVLEITEVQPDTFQMTATLTNGGAPVTDATVQAELQSFPVSDPILVDYFDDGLHDDGAAGDGVYGATAGPLPDLGVLTGYGILLHSFGPGFELFTVADLVVAPNLYVDGFETGDTSNWDQTSPAPASVAGGGHEKGIRSLRPLRAPAIY